MGTHYCVLGYRTVELRVWLGGGRRLGRVPSDHGSVQFPRCLVFLTGIFFFFFAMVDFNNPIVAADSTLPS